MELDGMLDENFNLTIWKDYPAFISSIFFLYRPFILLFSRWQQQGCNCDGLNRASRFRLWKIWSRDNKRMDQEEERNIFQELNSKDRIGFEDMFCMSFTDYEHLLSLISDLISPNDIISGNKPILADERLAMTKRYLAAGEFFQSLRLHLRISLVEASYIVKGYCSAINDRLRNMFIEFPDSWEKWLKISRKFEQLWNYPHSLGEMDGKHVRIPKARNGRSYFYNYKHTYSTILSAITGPEYECVYVDVRSNGRVNGISVLYGISVHSFK